MHSLKRDICLARANAQRAVLLFHGLTGGPAEMGYYAKMLFAAGYAVYCPVLPGHCEGINAIKALSWADWYRFALAEFDKLSEKYESVFVSGMCMGAILALLVARERKSVAAVSAISPTLFLDGWSIPWYSCLLPVATHTVLKFLYSFPEGGSYGVKNPKARERVKASLARKESGLDCFPLVCVMEQLRIGRYFMRHAAEVSSPLILFHAQKDDLSSAKSADFIFRKVSSAVKEYIKLEDSYHLLVLDNDKDTVFQKTVEFFHQCTIKKAT